MYLVICFVFIKINVFRPCLCTVHDVIIVPPRIRELIKEQQLAPGITRESRVNPNEQWQTEKSLFKVVQFIHATYLFSFVKLFFAQVYPLKTS